VRPDRDGIDNVARQPALREHTAKRTQEKWCGAERASTRELEHARARHEQQRRQRPPPRVHLEHEPLVGTAGAWPAVLQLRHRVLQIEKDPDRPATVGLQLVELCYRPQIERRDVGADSLERPLETRFVEQDVGSAVEGQAAGAHVRCESADVRPGLEELDTVAEHGKTRRGGETTNASADDHHVHR
jgi:hypothetical protein